MSNSLPLVSVIIPNYNYARYLEARIQSVLEQDFQDFELILLDDASTDNSNEIIERYRNNPKVSHIVVNDVNTGSPFTQWQRGIELAQGRYIWIAEADDLASRSFLSAAVGVLENNPGASVAISMSDLIDSDGQPSDHPSFDTHEADGSVHIYDGDRYIASRMLQRNSCYNASMTLFRKSVYHQLTDHSFTAMRFTGDWYFWTLMITGRQIAEIHLNLNRFRLHPTSTTKQGDKTSLQACEDALTVLWILEHNSFIPPGIRRARIYGLFRNLLKGRYHAAPETEQKISATLARLGISKRNYPAYWLYKHLCRPLTRHLESTSLLPVAISHITPEKKVERSH